MDDAISIYPNTPLNNPHSSSPEIPENYSKPPRLKDVLFIALPMLISQASEVVNMFVDRLFLSNLGKYHISGAMSGGVLAFCTMSFFIGVIGFVNAMVAQNDGSGQKHKCARSAMQGIYLAVFGWPILIILIPVVRYFFMLVDHDSQQIEMEMAYFRILIYGSIFYLLRQAFTGFFAGIGRTKIVMLASVIGMIINIPANWILIFGKMGFPALGIEGAAIGTIFSNAVIMVIFMSIYLSKKYRREFGTHREFRLNKESMKTLVEFGTPMGGEIFLNISAFSLFLQLMYSYGPDTATATTIVLNYDGLAFFPMIGFGFAATTLAGRYMGANNIVGAKRASRMCLYSAWSFAMIFVFLFVFFAEPLVTLYTRNLPDKGIYIIPLATTMLRLAAIYSLTDATQLILAGSLRGAGDTKFVMWISIILHWVFALLVWVGVKVLKFQPLSIWIVFIGFVVSMAIVLFLRYRFGNWQDIKILKSQDKTLPEKI